MFPPESEIFGEVTPETAGLLASKREVIPMVNTSLYKTDALGLKTLNEQGKVQIIKLDEEHVDFTDKDVEEIFIPFLKK